MERQCETILRKPEVTSLYLSLFFWLNKLCIGLCYGIKIVAAFVFVYCWIVSDDMRVYNFLIISNTGLQSKERHYCNEKARKHIHAKWIHKRTEHKNTVILLNLINIRLMGKPLVILLTSDWLSKVVCCRCPRKANKFGCETLIHSFLVWRLSIRYRSCFFHSCIFHPCYLLLHFPLLHFPSLLSILAFSTPAFSTPAVYSCIFHSRIFSASNETRYRQSGKDVRKYRGSPTSS